jgi:hypothetical protein
MTSQERAVVMILCIWRLMVGLSGLDLELQVLGEQLHDRAFA